MAKTVMIGVVGATVVLSGCEVLIPLWIASENGSPTAYEGYDGYWDDSSYETVALDVELEQLSGVVEGRPIDLPMGAIDSQGTRSGASANFSLTSAPAMTEPDDELSVVLDVCPIDEYASGGPISDPSSSYLNLYVCRGDDCLDTWGWGSIVEVDVADDATGRRRVVADSLWPDGSQLSFTLSYVTSDGGDPLDR